MVPVLVGRLVTLRRQEMSPRTGYRRDGWRVRGWSSSMQTNKARAKTGAFEDNKRMAGKASGRADRAGKDSRCWRAEACTQTDKEKESRGQSLDLRLRTAELLET